ncbi:MAG TPA: Ig-like domain-containing protein [Arsenicitalea sp.]|nr:Ig-like domain-containing protein [Arsenicitalea sp.]
MSKIYYVNSATGSDANAGTSATAALQSIDALERIRLNPGDTVLFARGTTYSEQLTVKYSGTVSNPITFGAYGSGDAPLFTDANHGISGSKTNNIVVQDLAVSHTTSNAIYAHLATNWTVQNVHVSDTGSDAQSGAISFAGGSNIAIKGNSISGVNGDGIWIDSVKGVSIEHNTVTTVVGHNSDNVQVVNSSQVSIQGNTLDMTGATDSAKGNLVVNTSDGVVIEHNLMMGGGYGASVNSDNVTIASNEIFGQTGYTWTFGIGLGENWDVSNYDIHDNFIHDVKFGIAVTGSGTTPVMRTDVDIHNNTFDNISGAALKVDRPASGDFHDNEVSVDSPATRISADVSAAGTFVIGENGVYVGTGLDAGQDLGYLGKTVSHVDGNLLANDTSDPGTMLSVTEFGGKLVGSDFELDGKYGSVTVDHDGSFIYNVDESAMQTVAKPVSDVFSYIVSDGQHLSNSWLTINLAARVNFAPVVADDGVRTHSDGSVSGNVLANDHDANGDTLYVRSVDTTKVATAPVSLIGDYGTLTIASNGSYSYQLDAAKVHAGQGTVSDVFAYKISDGILQDAGSLTIHTDVPNLVFDSGLHA